MEKKKILITANLDSFFHKFLIPYLQYYHEQGYEVHVASNGNDNIPYADKKFNVCFTRKIFDFDNFRSFKQMKKIVKENQYDLIICHTPLAGIITRLINIPKKQKRVVYTAHGFHFYKGSSLISWLLYYPIEKFLSRFTDEIITINQEDYALAKKKFHCEVSYTHGIGIDTKKFSNKMSYEEKQKMCDDLGILPDDFVLIFPAELNKNKNQILLIEIMKELSQTYSNFKLLLPGTGNLDEYYKKIVADYGLNDKIKFLGFRKDIPQLMEISDVSISSSIREGLPINILEALVSGLPVIATDNRGHRDIVKNGENGYLISYDDKEEFIKKILVLYDKKNKHQDFAFNEELIKPYYLENVLKETVMIYERKN